MKVGLKLPLHVTQGFIDSLLIIFLTFLPSIIAVLSALLRSKFAGLGPQFLSGEFLLYSVSFFCAAYLVFSERAERGKNWRSNASKFIFGFLSLAAALYGVLMSVEKPDYAIVRQISIAFFFISIPTFIYSQIENNKPSPDIQAQRTVESQKIEDALK